MALEEAGHRAWKPHLLRVWGASGGGWPCWAPGCGLSELAKVQEKHQEAGHGKDDMSWIQPESPIINIIAMWPLPWVQQKSSGHRWPVSPPQGLCVSEGVPETTVGLVCVPGLFELPGIAALIPRGTEGARDARRAVLLLGWAVLLLGWAGLLLGWGGEGSTATH